MADVRPQPETLELKASYIEDVPGGAFHTYVTYKDAYEDVRYVEAGPTNRNPELGLQAFATMAFGTFMGSPWGAIAVETGLIGVISARKEDVDARTMSIKSGYDLSPDFEKIKEGYLGIVDEKTLYGPTSTNRLL